MRKRMILGSVAIVGLVSPAWAETVDLDAVRAAVDKFKDVEVALAAGYIPDPAGACVSAAAEGLPAELGAMGIHYINPGLLKITETAPRLNGVGTNTDWSNPSVLLYEPQADGSLELTGVENLVWQSAWAAEGNTAAPEINGKVWDTMADDAGTAGDEAHGFAPHYDQHVWLYRDNPAGMMMAFNPNVSCENHAGN